MTTNPDDAPPPAAPAKPRVPWMHRRWLRRLLGLQPIPVVAKPVAPQASDLADAPLDVLASKILFSHMRNRQQLLGPPPTAFGHLDNSEAELLIGAAVSAAHAGGRFDEDEERRLRGALSSFGLQTDTRGFMTQAIRAPTPLEVLLRGVRDPHLASLFYAASLLAIDKHDDTDRAYLHFLATRLKLPAETLARLHSQFGFAVE